jgi:hypothetical protein
MHSVSARIVVLTPEEQAELDAAIEDADRSKGISGEEMLRRLRALREQDDREERR